jgi:hypothetical protein
MVEEKGLLRIAEMYDRLSWGVGNRRVVLWLDVEGRRAWYASVSRTYWGIEGIWIALLHVAILHDRLTFSLC